MAQTIAKDAQTYQLRQEQQKTSARSAAGVLSASVKKKLVAAGGTGVALESSAASVASARRSGGKPLPEIDPTTGLPAYLSEEEATKNMLLAGGRFDVLAMQRAAVERARVTEMKRMQKVTFQFLSIDTLLPQLPHLRLFVSSVFVAVWVSNRRRKPQLPKPSA